MGDSNQQEPTSEAFAPAERKSEATEVIGSPIAEISVQSQGSRPYTLLAQSNPRDYGFPETQITSDGDVNRRNKNPELSGRAGLDPRIETLADNLKVFQIAGNASDPIAFARAVSDAANRIATASPEALQAVFTQVFKDAEKFTGYEPATFGRKLNQAWELAGQDKYRVSSSGAIAILWLGRDADPQSGGEVQASAFQGDSILTREVDRKVFDTAMQAKPLFQGATKGLSPEQAEKFLEQRNSISRSMNDFHLFEPLPALPARVPPSDALSSNEQAAKLAKTTSLPLNQNALADFVLAANKIAFAKPSEMQERLTQAYDSLSAKYKELPIFSIAPLLRDALNIATNSNDFSYSSEFGDNTISSFMDKRLISEASPNGTFGATFTTVDQLNAKIARRAFDFNLSLAKLIRESAQSIPQPQRMPGFYNSVITSMRWLPEK